MKIVEAGGKNYMLPTCDWTKLGLTVERREKEDGKRYFVNLYNREAQESVIDNLDAVFELHTMDD